jgi:hypothetical protein
MVNEKRCGRFLIANMDDLATINLHLVAKIDHLCLLRDFSNDPNGVIAPIQQSTISDPVQQTM